MADDFKATGYFANRGIGHFKPCVIDGVIDAKIAKEIYGLNDAQLPLLAQELEAAGMLKKSTLKTTTFEADAETVAMFEATESELPTSELEQPAED